MAILHNLIITRNTDRAFSRMRSDLTEPTKVLKSQSVKQSLPITAKNSHNLYDEGLGTYAPSSMEPASDTDCFYSPLIKGTDKRLYLQTMGTQWKHTGHTLPYVFLQGKPVAKLFSKEGTIEVALREGTPSEIHDLITKWFGQPQLLNIGYFTPVSGGSDVSFTSSQNTFHNVMIAMSAIDRATLYAACDGHSEPVAIDRNLVSRYANEYPELWLSDLHVMETNGLIQVFIRQYGLKPSLLQWLDTHPIATSLKRASHSVKVATSDRAVDKQLRNRKFKKGKSKRTRKM